MLLLSSFFNCVWCLLLPLRCIFLLHDSRGVCLRCFFDLRDGFRDEYPCVFLLSFQKSRARVSWFKVLFDELGCVCYSLDGFYCFLKVVIRFLGEGP